MPGAFGSRKVQAIVLSRVTSINRGASPVAWVAANHGVAVGQPLDAAGVVDRPAGEVVVRHPPHGLARRIDLDHQVAERAADQGVAVVEPDGRERHVGRGDLADDPALRVIFADDLIEQLRHKIMAASELPRHPRLEVMVPRLGLDGDLGRDLAVSVDLQDARAIAGLGQQDAAVVEGLDGVDLRLRPLESDGRLAVASDLHRRPSGILRPLVEREQDATVRQDPAVSRGVGIAPKRSSRRPIGWRSPPRRRGSRGRSRAANGRARSVGPRGSRRRPRRTGGGGIRREIMRVSPGVSGPTWRIRSRTAARRSRRSGRGGRPSCP